MVSRQIIFVLLPLFLIGCFKEKRNENLIQMSKFVPEDIKYIAAYLRGDKNAAAPEGFDKVKLVGALDIDVQKSLKDIVEEADRNGWKESDVNKFRKILNAAYRADKVENFKTEMAEAKVATEKVEEARDQIQEAQEAYSAAKKIAEKERNEAEVATESEEAAKGMYDASEKQYQAAVSSAKKELSEAAQANEEAYGKMKHV